MFAGAQRGKGVDIGGSRDDMIAIDAKKLRRAIERLAGLAGQ